MDFARKLAQQLRQIWLGMSRVQQLAVSAAGLVALALCAGVFYWTAQLDYVVLYTGLSAEDAGAVTGKLQNQGVTYRLAAGGTTVLVPSDQVQQVRIELAAEGLPAKSGRGFELFDQTSLGMTPFTQHVNYLRALQAELARTIMGIDPVVFARVHIVRPEPSPFLRDQKPPTASVVLKLRPGTSLNKTMSAGIVALVARSVEGLARENVTLVDTSGRLLTEEYNADMEAVGAHLEQRRELEAYLAAKAEGMLTHALGPGRAIVRVTADINLKRHRETKETYSPDGRVITSEKITTTRSTHGSAKGITPGATSNLIRAGGTSGGGGAGPGHSNNTEEKVETNFAVSKVTHELEDKHGVVERLTIAALVDLSKTGAGDAGPSLSLADVQEIIKQAVGFKANRDEIKITQAKLGELVDTTLDEQWLQHEWWQRVFTLVRYSSIGIAALSALGLGWVVLRRRRGEAAPAPAAEPEPDDNVIRLGQMGELLQKDPQLLARVLEGWLDRPGNPPRAAG